MAVALLVLFKPSFRSIQANVAAVEESGVNEAVTNKFPGSEVKVGSAASGAGDNREIPLDEGGDINRKTGKYVGTWDT